MIITFLISLLILALYLIKQQRKKIGKCLLIFSFLLFIIIGTGLLPKYLLIALENPYLNQTINWQHSNAIVLLGGGNIKLPKVNTVLPGPFSYARIYEAARLYYSCKQNTANCKIIVSGGVNPFVGISEAEIYRQYLTALKVNNTDILIEDKSKNTYENAKFTQSLLTKFHLNNIVLVTSGFHMKRALLYFNYFNIYPTPAPADYFNARVNLLPLAYNFLITDIALHEYGGMVKFSICNILSWCNI